MTKKQKRFAEEYLIDLNATQAAIRAGYKVTKTKSASEIGAQLLKNTQVSEAIQQAMAERSRRTGISQDRVLTELAKIAFVNAADVIDPETAMVLPSATLEDTAAIQSIKVKESFSDSGQMREREVRMADKLKALELLGKHLGMFKEKVELSGLDKEKSKLDDLVSQLRGGDAPS